MDTKQFEGHTPGPWTAVEWTTNVPITIMAASSIVVANLANCGRHSDECLADARLIAAAPTLLQHRNELLASLKAVLDAYTRLNDEVCGEVRSRDTEVLIQAALDAIAKAEGGR